ncbi:MAG: hypothetical protein QOK15_3354 [Nocardioidaceae bacterium]|nr:hypothetical protein [Nocardioidaceae bacterium]
MVSCLTSVDEGVGDAERIDQIRLLEELKAAAGAAQAKVTAKFVASQHAAQVDAGLAPERIGKGVASQVGLAKRESPCRARRYVGWCQILTTELPCTFRALQEGRINEWRAMIVARETGWLSLPHRTSIDEEISGALESWGDRQVEAEVKKRAYRLDPHGFLDRIRTAESERRVTLRPAPDTMSVLAGVLPVAQGVSVFASLQRHADSLRAAGDERSRGQIMADTLVERVTGRAIADAVPVEVGLVMTDQTLFNLGTGSHEPAHVQDFGPVPAELARRLAARAAEAAELWVRRLYADPRSRDLVGMDSRRRCFDGALAGFLVVRDAICRTPWCNAPIRHKDHVMRVGDGGITSADNGQGLCEACNLAKEAPGWRARSGGGGGSGSWVDTVTPTGHTYRSRPPDPPGKTATPEPAGVPRATVA